MQRSLRSSGSTSMRNASRVSIEGRHRFMRRAFPLLKSGIARGTSTFSDDYGSLRGADIIFIAVGTPSKPDGSIDLSQVMSASAHDWQATRLKQEKDVGRGQEHGDPWAPPRCTWPSASSPRGTVRRSGSTISSACSRPFPCAARPRRRIRFRHAGHRRARGPRPGRFR